MHTNRHELLQGQSKIRLSSRTSSLNFTQWQDGRKECEAALSDHGYRLKAGAYLYLSSSRYIRPLPRGFIGHVARPARSIRSRRLGNEAPGSVLPGGVSRAGGMQWSRA